MNSPGHRYQSNFHRWNSSRRLVCMGNSSPSSLRSSGRPDPHNSTSHHCIQPSDCCRRARLVRRLGKDRGNSSHSLCYHTSICHSPCNQRCTSDEMLLSSKRTPSMIRMSLGCGQQIYPSCASFAAKEIFCNQDYTTMESSMLCRRGPCSH